METAISPVVSVNLPIPPAEWVIVVVFGPTTVLKGPTMIGGKDVTCTMVRAALNMVPSATALTNGPGADVLVVVSVAVPARS